MEKYLSRLTEAEMDEAEKIEAELNALGKLCISSATAAGLINLKGMR